MNDMTLQINLSAGDIAYADLMVRSLVAAHRASVVKTMAVVDCCRPQRTKIVDPATRFPPGIFEERVARIRRIAETLQAEGVLDDVRYLCPGDPLIDHLSERYAGSWIRETHDYGGCGFMSYFAGLELPETRFVIHYDADIVLHQSPDQDWAVEARALMLEDEQLVAATPRIAPPIRDREADEANIFDTVLPVTRATGGWRDPWFSTRCFLIDRERLSSYLPLVRGLTLAEVLAVRYLNRGYPRSPEILMYRTIGKWGRGRRLMLANEQAWFIHPHSKPPRYLELLPQILAHVQRNDVPDEQRGRPEIDLPAWEAHLSQAAIASSQTTSTLST